jgi:hypothetical protein
MKKRNVYPLTVLFVVAPLLLTFMAAQISAQDDIVVPDVGFEVEGNIALDHGGDYDWEVVGFPPAVLIQDPNSKAATDPTIFRPNSKFDRPETWSILPSQVGPGQNELTNVMAWGILPGDLGSGRPGDYWLVLGMERTKQQGTFALDFEFNQVAWDGSSGGPTRTPGDLAVGFELQGNPADRQTDLQVLIVQYLPGAQPSLCTVTPGVGVDPALVEPGTAPCPPYGDGGWFYRLLADGTLFANSGLGQATMNEDPFFLPEWWLSTDAQGDPRSEIGTFQFAEAVLNLTELGYEANCSTFSTVHAKSRASLEVRSDLKDLVGPLPLGVNCRLDGHKFLDVDGDGQWEEGVEPALENWEIRLSDGRVTHTNAEGYYAFEDLPSGTYTVREECPDDWAQTAPALSGFDTCGDFAHTAEISPDHREAHLPHFGNGQPALSLTCTSPSDVFVGDDIEYEIWVTNVGNVDLRDVAVADSRIGLSQTLDLAPGESQKFTGTYPTRDRIRPCGGGFSLYLPLVVRGLDGPEPDHDTIANPVTASGRYALATVEAFDDCATRLHELKVGQEVQTSLQRQYDWTITKTVDDPGPIGIFPGDFVSPLYTVTVDLDTPPFTDRDWSVEGTFTVDNPAPMDAQLASLTAVVWRDIPIEPICPSLAVPAGGSLTCTYDAVRLPDGSDRPSTATATLINNNGLAADFCGTAGIDFGQARVEEIDEEVDVKDHFPYFGSTVDLGVVQHDETPRTLTDTNRITAEGKCEPLVIDNVATLTTCDTHTSRNDTVTVEILELCPSIGYEDLPRDAGNDWDYNDLVIDVSSWLTVSAQHDLLGATFTITQQREAGPPTMTTFTHEFHLQPYADAFTCPGSFTLTRTKDGDTTTETGAYQPGEELPMIIADTGNPPDLVELTIDFDVPPDTGCPFNFSDVDPTNNYHGEWLFFDPWLKVHDTGEKISVDSHKDECECRILTVPTDWGWPDEGEPIWQHYEKVQAPDPARPDLGPIFCPRWWDQDQ